MPSTLTLLWRQLEAGYPAIRYDRNCNCPLFWDTLGAAAARKARLENNAQPMLHLGACSLVKALVSL